MKPKMLASMSIGRLHIRLYNYIDFSYSNLNNAIGVNFLFIYVLYRKEV